MNTVHRFIYAIIAFGLVLAVLIFALDPLVNAVGLRTIYHPFGSAVGVISLVLIPFVILYERIIVKGRLIYLIVLIVIGIIAATPLRYLLIIVGWFTGLITGAMFISASIIMVVFGVVFVIIFLLSIWYTKTKSMIQAIIILLLIYSGGYFIGIAATPAYAEAEMSDRLVYNNHQYFLYLHWGWLGDPDTLLLYECNAIGINCELTYRAPSGYYRERDLSLVVNQQTNAVEVSVDGQLSPHDLTEDDVRYLCTFFRASSNDPFCREPRFQDRYTFISMIQRTLGEINYDTVRPLFKSAQTEDGTDCLTPEEARLKTKDKDITCKLRFSDDKPYYVTLYMTNDYDPVWYRLSLIIPGSKND